jgi:hypothetical protein
MRRLRSRTAVLIVATFAVGSLFAPTAGAHRAAVQTSVSLQTVGPDGATGRVTSPRKECRSQRRVDFYRVNSEQSVPSKEPAGFTWTKGDGSWSIPPPLYTSKFVALVAAKKTKRAVCAAATSNSLGWD